LIFAAYVRILWVRCGNIVGFHPDCVNSVFEFLSIHALSVCVGSQYFHCHSPALIYLCVAVKQNFGGSLLLSLFAGMVSGSAITFSLPFFYFVIGFDNLIFFVFGFLILFLLFSSLFTFCFLTLNIY